MKRSVLRPLAALVALSCAAPAIAAEPPQVVLVSFDGASDVALWKRSTALAETTGAHFTYFLSCVYLLAPEHRGIYKGPVHRSGRSNVGFGASKADVTARLTEIWKAHNKGHEIASHGCGHFDGKDWTAAQWSAEFKAFDTILRDAWTLNGDETPAGWRHMTSMVRGFRAPYLSVGPALDKALAGSGLDYDASGVSRGPAEPGIKDGIVRFALPLIPEGPRQRPIIAMDYNLYVRHSAGLERPSESARVRGTCLCRLPPGLRRGTRWPPPSAGDRPAFPSHERWRLLAGDGAACPRGLPPRGRALHDLSRIRRLGLRRAHERHGRQAGELIRRPLRWVAALRWPAGLPARPRRARARDSAGRSPAAVRPRSPTRKPSGACGSTEAPRWSSRN